MPSVDHGRTRLQHGQNELGIGRAATRPNFVTFEDLSVSLRVTTLSSAIWLR